MNPIMKSCPIFSRDVNSRPATSQTPIDEILDQEPGADPGRTLGNLRAFPFAPIGAGDVDMHPGTIAGELAQKESRRDPSASAPADISHIGHIAAQLLKILIP